MTKVTRKRIRTRATSQESMEVQEDGDVATDSNSVLVAPTAVVAERRSSQEVQLLKVTVEHQKDKIDELKKERDFLKEQLASALQNASSRVNTKKPLNSDLSNSDTVSELSVSVFSETESGSASEEEKKKKKEKKKEKKGGKETDYRRAQTPKQVIKRYKNILKLYRRGGTMSRAFKKYGVDRNMVVLTAPIAELSILAPQKFQDLLETYTNTTKLAVFASRCSAAILEDE